MVVKTTLIRAESRPRSTESGSGSRSRLISGVLAVLFLLASLLALYEVAKTPRPRPSSAQTSNSIQTIRAFYAALNGYMETGDTSAVTEILAPDALAFVPLQGAMGKDSGLLTYLLALRSTMPQLRFTVDRIDAGGDIAIASVRISGRADASAAMPSVSGISQEFFRVRDGRIVQHWTTTPSLALLQPLTKLPMQTEFIHSAHLAIAELIFPPGQGDPAPIDGPALLLVQRGRLTLTGNGSSQILHLASGGISVSGPNERASAGPGQAISIPKSRTIVQNRDSGVAHVHIATLAYDPRQFWDSMPGDLQSLPPPTNDMSVMGWDRATVYGGVTVRPLAFDDRAIPAGTRELDIAWAVLGPGASLPLAADGEWSLVHVMSGSAQHLTPNREVPSELPNTLTNTGDQPVLALVIRLRATH